MASERFFTGLPTPPWRTGRALGLSIALLIGSLAGCGQPPLQPPALQFAQALDAVLERQDTVQLQTARHLLSEKQQRGEIDDQESRTLASLIDAAQAGDWDSAHRRVRQLLAAQNGW